MSSVSLSLTYCTRSFQTGLVRAGRCHDIGRVEFRQGNIILCVLFSDGRIPKLCVHALLHFICTRVPILEAKTE